MWVVLVAALCGNEALVAPYIFRFIAEMTPLENKAACCDVIDVTSSSDSNFSDLVSGVYTFTLKIEYLQHLCTLETNNMTQNCEDENMNTLSAELGTDSLYIKRTDFTTFMIAKDGLKLGVIGFIHDYDSLITEMADTMITAITNDTDAYKCDILNSGQSLSIARRFISQSERQETSEVSISCIAPTVESDSGLSGGAIAGIVIGGIVVATGLSYAVYKIWPRKNAAASNLYASFVQMAM